MKPFRWNITRREQLGKLVDGSPADAYPRLTEDLRQCAARVVASAGDSDFAFVGRSPETLFDYLSGILLETSWASRLVLVNLSMRSASPERVEADHPGAIAAFRAHLTAVELSPAQLIQNSRPVALADLVATGGTFKHVTEHLLSWASDDALDLPAVRSKIRYVGITWRTKTSPNTFRWHQHAPWLATFSPSSVKNVSIPGRLWDYLGNKQAKVALSHPPWRWADPTISEPPRQEENLSAVRLALEVFDSGTNPAERARFTDLLCKQHSMKYRWCRSLVSELRRVAA